MGVTPEEFETLVAQGDPMKLAEAVESLDESQRRKLSKTASQLLRETRRRSRDFRQQLPDSPLWTRIKGWLTRAPKPWLVEHTAQIAVLAVSPFSEVRKIRGPILGVYDSAVLKVLSDRRPDWGDKWVDLRLKDEARGIPWWVIQALVKQGVCGKPTSDGYLRLMAEGLPSAQWDRDDKRPLSQRLLEEPELLEDVWRLFEVETYAFSYELQEHPGGGYEGWTTALVKLADQGHLDRQRLLDASLSGLTTGFKNHVLSGYIRLHERLQPTVDELAARQQTLVDLLSNQAPHVVTFALKMLKKVEKGKKLDGQAFLSAVAPVFQIRTKSQPKSVLSLIGGVVKREPELVPWALNSLIEALAHESPEVQEQAVGLLEAWLPRAHTDHAAAIRERSDDLAPTARARLEPLLAKLGGAEPTAITTAEESENAAAELAALRDRVDKLDEHWRKLAAVDAALEAATAGTMPGPFQFDLMDVPVLTSAEPIEPIRSVDALIDAVAHAIETIDSADEVERILDGISRLSDQRPDDFEARTEPLLKRIEDARGSEAARGLAGPAAPFALRRLLIMWLRRKLLVSTYGEHLATALQRFIDARLNELIDRVRAGRSAPLLSAPTHRHGWIDPSVLVDRTARLLQQGQEIGECDLILALLRLAPDRRAQALDAASLLPGHVGRAVRWALGHDEGPTEEDRKQASLWLAAGRARDPRGTLDVLRVLGLGDDVPDAVTPATYSWRAGFQTPKAGWVGQGPPFVEFDSRKDVSARSQDGLPLRPTVVLHERASFWYFLPAWQIQWIALIWPSNCDAFFLGGIHGLMSRLDMPASSLQPNFTYLEPLFEPDRPWTEMARLAVWIALVSTDADSRGTALDTLVEAVGDGRAHPAPMADVLVRLAASGWVLLNRVANSLREVARLSPLHAWFAAETLQALIGSYDKLPRDAHHVLRLLLELLTELGLALSPAARERLAPIKGSSKTAKSARSLVALKSSRLSAKMQRAQAQMLEARITRAQRWASSTAEC